MSRPRRGRSATDDNFAANLAAARAARGWGVDYLAELATEHGAPMGGAAVWKSERGRGVTVGEAVALSAALGVDLLTMLAEPRAFRVALVVDDDADPLG